ncbi:MAG: 4-hydroxy-3-methylbut-2-enyl diphosphate reductase [Deltaproteobacteria bacterium]|jgi:4-hydroxy-3-methylbut-2-enyl diphosphate reductase|nr:4-hydroxy-3-methylbut-2-enyl diphosphate reductase [Deltaproteobacteria bacterium]
MLQNLHLPQYYKSTLIEQIKSQAPNSARDQTPYTVQLGKLTFKLARHFGFCFGVQQALSLAYKTIAENKGKRVFLLSEIIHNPIIYDDLVKQGIKFLMDSKSNILIPFETLKPDDIVLIPAFGITLELRKHLQDLGIDILRYDTTCPFVQKVWNTVKKLGQTGYTIIIHGNPNHEETKATFSYAQAIAPTLILKNKNEALKLADFIKDRTELSKFNANFRHCSKNFDPQQDLIKIGLVQQTTMLTNETEEISEILKTALNQKNKAENIGEAIFADTKHTLCYATQANQLATKVLCQTSNADLAFIVGGYNSSNTKHLVELASQDLKTFFIKDSAEILNSKTIRHFDIQTSTIQETTDWLPTKSNLIIAISAGASCPDKALEEVMLKIQALAT